MPLPDKGEVKLNEFEELLQQESVVEEAPEVTEELPVEVKAVKSLKQKFEDEKAKLPKGPIQVVAVALGFYKGSRKSIGDKFTIEGKHQFGTWMKKI